MFMLILNRMSRDVDSRELNALYLRAELLTIAGFRTLSVLALTIQSHVPIQAFNKQQI
jgi:hypothetical protein